MSNIKEKYYTYVTELLTRVRVMLKQEENYEIEKTHFISDGARLLIKETDPRDQSIMYYEITIKPQPLMDPNRGRK